MCSIDYVSDSIWPNYKCEKSQRSGKKSGEKSKNVWPLLETNLWRNDFCMYMKAYSSEQMDVAFLSQYPKNTIIENNNEMKHDGSIAES